MQLKFKRRKFVAGTIWTSASQFLSIPVLSSLMDTENALANKNGIDNFFTFYIPNGVMREGPNGRTKWMPNDTSLSGTSLESLKTHKEKLTFIEGLDCVGGSGNDHMMAIASFLTAKSLNEKTQRHSVSIDIAFAEHLKEMLDIGDCSLQLASNNKIDPPNNNNYNNALKNALSFDLTGNILPMTSNLKAVYQKVFSGFNPNPTKAILNDGKNFQKSSIDRILKEISMLRSRVSQQDKELLDQYLQSIREIEIKIAKASTSAQASKECALPNPNLFPFYDDSMLFHSLQSHFDLLSDLVVAGFICGRVKSVAYFPGGEASKTKYPDAGVNKNFHDTISHNSDKTGSNSEDWRKIDAFHAEMVSSLTNKMNGYDLLERSLILFGGGMASGYDHSLSNIPLCLLGATDFIDHRQHLKTDGKADQLIALISKIAGLPDKYGYNKPLNQELSSLLK